MGFKKIVPLLAVFLMVLASLVLFRLFQKQLANQWLAVTLNPRIRLLLEDSADNLKRLAELDPANTDQYRDLFSQIQEARQSLEILEHSRRNLNARYELLLQVIFGGIVLGAISFLIWMRRRTSLRLKRLQEPLCQLAAGEGRVEVPDTGRDAIGRIGEMIRQTAAQMAQQRSRLNYLKHLHRWQEAARRIGHELRTPLATMRLGLERMEAESQTPPIRPDRLRASIQSVLEEVERLTGLAGNFSTFAGIGKPRMKAASLNGFAEHFGTLFATAWPGVALEAHCGEEMEEVLMDKGMVRQVLMNLCNNSAHAMAAEGGRIVLSVGRFRDLPALEVSDDGPGIDGAVAGQLFDPYVSTKISGEGMGLGLAISRKIMLEHGGDLEMVETSGTGTRFRLRFQPADAEHQPGGITWR